MVNRPSGHSWWGTRSRRQVLFAIDWPIDWRKVTGMDWSDRWRFTGGHATHRRSRSTSCSWSRSNKKRCALVGVACARQSARFRVTCSRRHLVAPTSTDLQFWPRVEYITVVRASRIKISEICCRHFKNSFLGDLFNRSFNAHVWRSDAIMFHEEIILQSG